MEQHRRHLSRPSDLWLLRHAPAPSAAKPRRALAQFGRLEKSGPAIVQLRRASHAARTGGIPADNTSCVVRGACRQYVRHPFPREMLIFVTDRFDLAVVGAGIVGVASLGRGADYRLASLRLGGSVSR